MRAHLQSSRQKVSIITGSTSGIGLAAAKGIAGEGHFIIGIARSMEKAEAAKRAIRSDTPEAKVEYLLADLSSQTQVRALANNIRDLLNQAGKDTIDVLINNAGAVTSWFTLTEEGYETQFAVNHLAPFFLTNLLMPLIQRSNCGRIVTVSSGSHRHTRIHWKDVMLRKHYNALKAYKQSKLANVLFTYELNRRLGGESTTTAYAIDPGLVNTKIGTKGTSSFIQWIWNRRRKKGIPPEIAAESIIHIACRRTLPRAAGCWYWKGCLPLQPSRYARGEEEAEKLWSLSAKLCGIEAPIGKPNE